MSSKPFSPTSHPAERGFSLVEFLVAISLSGIALAGVVQFLATQARAQVGHGYRIELNQALRSSLDNVTRDLRLAGACLPATGDFSALGGQDGPGPDEITIRAGIVRNDMTCVRTSLSVMTPNGTSTLTVPSTAGFEVDTLVLMQSAAGHMYSFVTGVAGNIITIQDPANIDYPVGSGIFAVDERVYQIDDTGTTPRLMLTINRSAPQAFAVGMRDLQVSYVLAQNCPPCDTVDIPATDTDWRLVNEVIVTAEAETVGAVRQEDQVSLRETSRAKPRNLIQ